MQFYSMHQYLIEIKLMSNLCASHISETKIKHCKQFSRLEFAFLYLNNKYEHVLTWYWYVVYSIKKPTESIFLYPQDILRQKRYTFHFFFPFLRKSRHRTKVLRSSFIEFVMSDICCWSVEEWIKIVTVFYNSSETGKSNRVRESPLDWSAYWIKAKQISL